jgi:antirestriction protein
LDDLKMTETPRIYVVCLAAYTNGQLHSAWIDADQSADEIEAEIKAMLAASPQPDTEEWAIHAYEGFYDLTIAESENLETVAELAERLLEHGEAFAAYVAHVGLEYATEEGFQDSYRGEYASEEDFAKEFYCETQTIPEHLLIYIDWQKVATDLCINDFFSSTKGGSTYIFHRC